MSEDRTAQARQMEDAAKRADWMQVVLNQGPPCFALNVDGNGTFCLRAHRWAGHGQGEWPMHEFVSLADLIAALTAASAAKDWQAKRDGAREALESLRREFEAWRDVEVREHPNDPAVDVLRVALNAITARISESR